MDSNLCHSDAVEIDGFSKLCSKYIGNNITSDSKQHKHTSKITRRNQTTLPESVRKALGVKGTDTIEYLIESDRVVLIKYDEPEHADTVVQSFLKFIESDMVTQPSQIQSITTKWNSDLEMLVGHINVDLNEPI